MEKIFYLLERIYKMTHIPVRYLDASGEINLFHCGYEKKYDPILCDINLKKILLDKVMIDKYPTIMFEEQYIYGLYKDYLGNYIIFGPISSIIVSKEEIDKYKDIHNINFDEFNIKHRTIGVVCSALSILSFSITGNFIMEADIVSDHRSENKIVADYNKNEYLKYELEHMEEERERFNFSEEMQYIRHIKEGNPDLVIQDAQRRLDLFVEQRVGKLAEKSMKQNEYMAVTAIILASRAAIEGGLDSLTAYLMSDLYLQRLEKSLNISEIYRLIQEMAITFAKRVQEIKEEKSKLSYVEHCKNFIAKHLNKQFTIEEIAQEIGINKSYLSRIFSYEVGEGIQKYAQKKRIEASANMLRFSDMSILSISNYLCFTSQSHFGKVFKEVMGETPQKYRDKNKLHDFKS